MKRIRYKIEVFLTVPSVHELHRNNRLRTALSRVFPLKEVTTSDRRSVMFSGEMDVAGDSPGFVARNSTRHEIAQLLVEEKYPGVKILTHWMEVDGGGEWMSIGHPAGPISVEGATTSRWSADAPNLPNRPKESRYRITGTLLFSREVEASSEDDAMQKVEAYFTLDGRELMKIDDAEQLGASKPAQQIIVISFAPVANQAASGGHEWRRTWKEIEELVHDRAWFTPSHDYRVTTISLPGEFTDENISRFLERGDVTDIIDPPGSQGDIDEKVNEWIASLDE